MKLLSAIIFSLVLAIVCFAQQSGQVFGIGHWVTTSETYGRNALCAWTDSVNNIEISLYRLYPPEVRSLDTHLFYVEITLNGVIYYADNWYSTMLNQSSSDYYHKHIIGLNPDLVNINSSGNLEILIREIGYRSNFIEYIRDQIYSYDPSLRQITLVDDYDLISL